MAEGYKDWSAGDILTAADLEDYTVKQSVMRFADSSARTTALSGVLAEGMMSYLKDTDTVEVYDGSAWAAVAGGKILQVVQATTTTTTTTTSTSFGDIANLDLTITPSSATSKVLIQVNAAVVIGSSDYLRLTIFRGGSASGTNLAGVGNDEGFGRFRAISEPNAPYSIFYLDSPATTSATTYNAAWRVGGGTATLNNAGAMSTITVMEVSA